MRPWFQCGSSLQGGDGPRCATWSAHGEALLRLGTALRPRGKRRARDLVRVLARWRSAGQAPAGAQAPPGDGRRPDPQPSEAELRRRMASDVIVAGAARRTVGEAGAAYIDHLEHVMERKRTTIADYRGDLRKHLAPF